MTDKYEQEEEMEELEESVEDKKDRQDSSESGSDKGNDYEDVCFVCRRPESKAGKMFKLPNNICVCDDCMHKTMDAVSQFDYQGMLSDPQFQKDMDNMLKGNGMANIRFVNIADLQGEGGCECALRTIKMQKGAKS